jgi:glycosyltransferase involved in cell wall biosynthesis
MKEHIKIFVDGHVFDGPYQGTTTFIKGLYSEIAKMHPKLEILMGARDIKKLEKEFPPMPNLNFVSYTNSNKLRLFWDIPIIIKKYKPDVAHFQYISPPITKSTKYIVTIHDLLFNDFPDEFSALYRISRNIFFKKSALSADIITTDSQYSKELINKYYGIKKDKIYVIPIGINQKYLEKVDKKKAKSYILEKYGIYNYILYVSRIEPRKNHHLLLKSYLDLELWKKGICLVFIGSVSIKNVNFINIFDGVPKLIKRHIYLIDQIGEDDIIKFYAGAELFVYPSKAEGFGIPPIEASALGVKTICSNSTAMADFDFLGSGLFNCFDLNELKVKILLALEGKLFSNKQIINISNYVKNNYCWEESAGRFIDLLKKLAKTNQV